MFEAKDIIETISMIREECLDIRTITMASRSTTASATTRTVSRRASTTAS